jgi:hypothetical protein
MPKAETGANSQRDYLMKQIHTKKSKSHHYIRRLIEGKKRPEVSLPSLSIPTISSFRAPANNQKYNLST